MDRALSMDTTMLFNTAYTLSIDGRAVTTAAQLAVINPATGQVFAQAPDASQADLDQAVDAARRALPAWRVTPIADRQARMTVLADALATHTEDFAALLTREQGKPLADARAELGRCVHWLREFAMQALPVDVIEDTPRRRVELHYQPLGVVAAIVPWNFPMTLAVWKIAPALLAGNTMVLKPSPFTPLTALKLGELARDILPAGVLNVVSGGDALGPWLTSHPDIAKIAFTGSTPTGRAIMRHAASDLKRITLELGGNDAAIVLPDVDLAAVVPRLFWAAFANNAQFCLAAKRMYVHASIYEAFCEALVAYAKTVSIGDGSVAGVRIGPVQNRQQLARLHAMLDDARAAGLRLRWQSEVPTGGGYFFPLTLVDQPPDNAAVVTDEAFGPILPLLSFQEDDEVIARANASPFGLGASVWGRDIERARAIAGRLDTGVAWINTIHELSPHFPFGGHKQSGMGVENGLAGLLEYTSPQTLVINREAVAPAA